MGIHTHRKLKKVFCMLCGDSVSMIRYDQREKEYIPRRAWTTQEEERFRKLMDAGKRPRELAATFNRTPWAMRKKARRMGYKFD